ncbi:alpha/beta hydrolase [Anaerorhabdus furcosa]|uniref:Alpha/beta hydrolase family protein n=1 Tax=Anaerorhabdus furcosa TaxID=118967 RepID=A0A1T4KQE5_9FIRM|nr:alpha/beta fold hydrolase [Anaerorhabdus furcosa]SJZ44603.1 Alpha/beta hydrolase family protein [Anaerorhabdus furcosa]
MKKINFTAKKGLIISIVVTLLCLIGANLILSDFGKVKIETTTVQTLSGDNVSIRVYSPKTATSTSKAPAVVFTHGLGTTKECYAQYALELARRGFVVITPDMLNHGGSDITSYETFFMDPNSEADGSYAAVRYLDTLDYVDLNQIGVAGHSMGGNAANSSVIADDAAGNHLVSAVYLVSSDPLYRNAEGEFDNLYGDRSVGLYYTLYDHVYFATKDENGAPMNAQQYLTSNEAKSFVQFGASNPKDEQVRVGHTYKTVIDGKEVIRIINKAEEIHPHPQGGSGALAASVDFFQDTFEAPHYIVGTLQIWKFYSALSLTALFGALAICIFTVATLVKTKFFASLKAEDNKQLRPAPNKQGKICFWILTIANCAFAFISVSLIFANGYGFFRTMILPQQTTNIYALWACANGIFMLITSFGSYFLYGKKQGQSLKDWGLIIPIKDILKSILLAIIAVLSTLTVVYIAGYVFQMDLRYYLWGIRDMRLENYYLFFTYLPFYLIFGLAVSIALNSAYYSKIGKEPTWANDLFFAIMNMIPALAITVIGYWIFNKTGVQANIFGAPFTFTYMINAIPVFPVAVIVLRRIFKFCNNPYIPGIIVGALLCYMQVASVFTVHVEMMMRF